MSRPEEKIKVEIDKKKIEARVRQIAAELDRDYAGKYPVLLCNLNGAFRFMSDLIRYMKEPVQLDFLAFTSYKGTESSGEIINVKSEDISVIGRHVVIIDDIYDTGQTLQSVIDHIGGQNPLSLTVCVLIVKECAHNKDVNIDYMGFTITDEFVVGYGLDYNEHYRDLNYIGVIEHN